MFTSRSEYRLQLRTDNADLRLMDHGHRIGLVGADAYQALERYRALIGKNRAHLEKTRNAQKVRQAEPLNMDWLISEVQLEPWSMEKVRQQLEIQIKYDGYLKRQQTEIARFERMERRAIPTDFDYDAVKGLLTESRQKLKSIRPDSIGQAGRIPGVTPSDISLLLVHLERDRRSAV